LEDRRNVGKSSCNSGGGTDQRVQYLIFMMMMMMMMRNMDVSRKINIEGTERSNVFTEM
jgi:hypothetical protein